MKIARSEADLRAQFVLGARAAADVASRYNCASTHAYRLDDCILRELSISRCKPRKNTVRLKDPANELICGMALALAEMCRHGSDGSVRAVARDAGITLAIARTAGVDPYDLKTLKKAGVK